MSERRSLSSRLVGSAALLLLAACASSNNSPTAAPPSSSGSLQPSSSAAAPESPSTQPTQGTSPSHNVVLHGHLLFDRTAEGDVSNIYLYNAGHERQVTPPGGHAGSRVSPNHRLILVGPSDDTTPITGGTIDLNGKHYRRLQLHDPTLNLVPQAWSPNGSRIAFEGWDDSDPSRTGVYTARYPDGGDLKRVTTRPGLRHDIPLDYSPDGERIIFYRSAHGDPDPKTGGSLWTIGVDGSNPQRINGSAHPPDWARWSPDGDQILFANQRTSASGALWTVSPTGEHLRKVLDGSRGFPITPTWSPTGSQILFALDPTNDEFIHPNNVLTVMRANGTGLRPVIGSSDCKRWPEWWR